VVASHTQIAAGIDSVKKKLLDRRRQEFVVEGYDDDAQTVQVTQKKPLTAAEQEYIFDLLARDTLEEEDAELILTVMRDHATRAEKKLDYIIQKFPNLMKSVFNFCGRISDKEFLTDLLLKLLRSDELLEYQLFWFAHILEANLMATSKTAELISAIYGHPRATVISKAKILELADNRFGLAEMRETQLRTGQSDWLSWSAAVGERGQNKATRNYRLSYFSKASPMNHLIGQIVSEL